MGFYARPWRWVKVTRTRRQGTRVALGPRWARVWIGRKDAAGRRYQGWSTGWGPFSKFFPRRRPPQRRKRS